MDTSIDINLYFRNIHINQFNSTPVWPFLTYELGYTDYSNVLLPLNLCLYVFVVVHLYSRLLTY